MPRGGSGTGFLITGDGLLVTNHHVIEGAKTIEVHQGNMIYAASVVAQDPANDLANLKSDVRGRPLGLASARGSQRGDEVLTLVYRCPHLQEEVRRRRLAGSRDGGGSGMTHDIFRSISHQPVIPAAPAQSTCEVIGVVSRESDDAPYSADRGVCRRT